VNPEDVARLYSSSRAGFELVGQHEVGLPYWQLSLSCMVLSHKTVPPLTEFALRTIAAGLGSLDQIGGFLGLDTRTVTASLVPLFQDGHIRASSDDPGSFELSNSGVQLLDECEIIVPEETVFLLDYDGWTRGLVDLGNIIKYTHADLNKLGITPLPPFPDSPPRAEEITVRAVATLVRDTINRQQMGVTVRRDVLSVEGLHDKRKMFYARAVALLFKSVQSGEAQVAFAIDGRLSQEHEDAFARASGLKKLGVLEALKQSATDVARLELDPATVAAIHAGPEVTELVRVAALRKRELKEIEAAMAVADDSELSVGPSTEALEEARERYASTEARLTQYPVRMLEVFEHPELLEEALREASERLLIVSPWIKSAVVDKDFLASLEAALNREVDVTFCYGINRRSPSDGSDPAAIRSLEGLAQKYGNFQFCALGDTHAKVLIVDHRYLVVTSFNWLSFRGDPSMPFRDERGVLVSIPHQVQTEYEKYVARVVEASQKVD
jgi:PLD-like domain